MKLFRYFVLFIFICNIASIVLVSFGTELGSAVSYLTYALLFVYYFLNKKHEPLWPFVLFALSYFIIAGLVYVFDVEFYFFNFIKFLIIIVCGAELARNTNIKELFFILLLGAGSILIHALFFPEAYGRYSGFYLDPNSAGFLCLLGCALTFGLSDERWRILGLSFFTFCGVLTFSWTFLLLWALIISISIIQSRKNLKFLALGVGALFLFISVSYIFQLSTERFTVFTDLVKNRTISESIKERSRTETWAKYYDHIYERPIFGNGYLSFNSDNLYDVGVHNNYLRVIGESGLIPFILFMGIYLFILIRSFKSFKTKPYQFLIAVALFTSNLTNHNFENIYHVLFLTLWLYIEIINAKEKALIG